MRKYRFLPLAMAAGLIVAGCAADTDTTAVTTTAVSETTAGSDTTDNNSSNDSSAQTESAVSASDAEESRVEITGDFTVESEVTDGYSVSGTTYTFTKGGEYVLSGCLYGNIVVEIAEDEEIELKLNGALISSSDAAPIYVISADKVSVVAADGTFNEVVDARATAENTDSEDETETVTDATNAGAAIYADADLKIKGQGALVVRANYNNGIQSKDDLELKNLTLKVLAVNNALKGNDSVTVESGEYTVVSSAGDGIKSSNSDVSSKGNQRGVVTISGGNIDIYAAGDGISAAYDAVISGEGSINIYTDTYSNYSDSDSSSTTDFYLIVSQSDYSEDYDYYAYYYNSNSEDGTWVKAQYYTMVSGGRSASYYGLLVKAPSGYDSVNFYIFESGATPDTTNYVAAGDGASINTTMNGYLISAISDQSITGDYVNLTSGSSGSTATYSTKGIKAGNSVDISGATINISSTDDGIHVNSDELESGESGAGSAFISGGSITISTGDDGIHADKVLTIDDGYVNVVTSYEGLEAAKITINGGDVYVYATDDGINASDGSGSAMGGGMGGWGASSASSDVCITINGGYVDVTTPTGDTDAIDSNGNFIVNGGFVLVKGGNSSGSMAGSVDVDGSITVSAGTVVALGGICETPVNSVNTYVSSGTSFTAGDYVISDADGNEVATFSLTKTYSSGWFASEALKEGVTYTLTRDGATVLTWTQEAGTQGATGAGMGGFGGGGMGGGSRR